MDETQTGKFDMVDTKSGYAHSFGMMAGGTRYYDPYNGVDVRPQLKDLYETGYKAVQAKALTAQTGGAGTAGYAMIPVYVDPRIVDTTRKYTPLVEAIPRVTNMGMTADYNKITAKGGAYTRAEDAALTETNDTYDRASTAIKYLYSVGRTTGQARAGYPSYILEGFQATGTGQIGSAFSPAGAPNAKQLEVIMKARSMRELEENLIINGNATTSAITGNPNGTEFDGVVTLMAATNTVDKNTTAISYDDLELAMRYAFDDGGRPNIGVCSSDVMTDLRKIMIDTYNYRPVDMTTTLPFGVTSNLTLETMVGPVPMLPSMFLSNTTGSKAAYFLDMSVVEMRVLQDMTYEELAKTADSEKFMLKIYEALLIKNTSFCASITEISA